MASPVCKSCGTAAGDQPINKPHQQTETKPATEIPQSSAPPLKVVSPLKAPSEEVTQVQVPSAQNKVQQDEIRQVFFHGTGGSLLGIHIVNTFLTIITLGIYYFWGKVRVRSYLMSQTEFEGDRFAYHGTGKELMIGFFKAAVAFGSFYVLMNIIPYLPGGIPVKVVVFVLAYGLLLLFIPMAMVGTRRYRLSRTSWREIRFSFRGKTADFIKVFLKGMLLTVFTLGFYKPYFDTRRYAFMASNSYIGNQKFEFDGQGRDLFRSYLLGILLTLPTMGLYWFWFGAKKLRYLWDHTLLGAARFHCTVTGTRLLLLSLGNLLLLIFTLGLAWPWIVVRNVQFVLTYLSLEGPLNLEAIQQDAQAATATGEGLDSILNLDTGLDAA
jgi:uncharacterized membrane protein YjgN (DUF898 family)